MTINNFTVTHDVPSVAEYCQMRIDAGLQPKSHEAASIGLPKSVFGVSVRDDQGRLIAMGRLVGDGGCFVQVCDIAVHPSYQGQGLGRRVMQELMTHVENQIPKSAWINLFADGTASALYAQFGFEETAPVSIGMAKAKT